MWDEEDPRRNGVSPFFSLSLFNFRCCSSTLTQRLVCKGYVTGKKISYFPFAFTDDKLSQPLSCTSSLYFRRLLPESEQVLQKTAPEATFKIISGELQSSWCDECVSFAYFALVAPMLASFMPFVKGLLLKKISCVSGER